MSDETTYDPVTGEHLKDWGHRSGVQFPALLKRANEMRAEGFGLVRIQEALHGEIPPAPKHIDPHGVGEVSYHENIEISHSDEEDNVTKVRETMHALMRTPTPDWVVTAPVDAPFLPEDLVRRLMAGAAQAGTPLAVAASGGRTHPVVGLWRPQLRDDLAEALLVEKLRKIDRWTARHGCAAVDWPIAPVDPFFNANTPEDVAAADDAGMQAHLAKPIVFADLAQALGRWLPTRIVEAPMDRDVPMPSDAGTRRLEAVGEDREEASHDAFPMPNSQAEADPGHGAHKRATIQSRWRERRSETIEAVREGLANGLIGNQTKRRAQDKADRQELTRMIHKLAGTAATFGEAELGKQASALEHAMAGKGSSAECEELAFAVLALADDPPRAPAGAPLAKG